MGTDNFSFKSQHETQFTTYFTFAMWHLCVTQDFQCEKSRPGFDWIMTTGSWISEQSHTRMPPEMPLVPTFEEYFWLGLAVCFQEHLNSLQFTSFLNLLSFTLIAINLLTSNFDWIHHSFSRIEMLTVWNIKCWLNAKLRVALTLQRVLHCWVQEGSGGPTEQTQPEKDMVVKNS